MTTPHGSRAWGFWNDAAVSSHGLLQDIHTGIAVAVHDEATVRTLVDADRKENLLAMTTARAGLRRVGRRDAHHGSRGLFRLREQLHEKRRPCRIIDAFCQAGILDHVAHDQGLHRDQPEAIDQLARLLLHKVLAPPADALMDTRHHLAPLRTLFGALLSFSEAALDTGKGMLLLPEEPGVLDPLASREIGKGGEPHINTNLELRWGQDIRLHLVTGERHVPFVRSRSGDGSRLHDAFERTVHHELEMSNFREAQFALFIDAKTRLWVGQAPVAILGFITGIAGRQSSFDTTEERLEGFIHPMQDILQDLRVDALVLGADLLDLGQLRTLLRKRDALAAHPPSISALLKGSIVQFRAQGQLFMQRVCLLLSWVDPVAIGFPHIMIFFSDAEKRKRSPVTGLEKERAFHPPVGKARGLQALELGRNTIYVHNFTTYCQCAP